MVENLSTLTNNMENIENLHEKSFMLEEQANTYHRSGNIYT